MLREDGERSRVLPILIGGPEAAAIHTALEGITPPRPLTHDLAVTVFQARGATLERVVITEVLFEFAASDAESLRAAARFHYNVDKFGELPILVAVLVTGTILAVRAWPLTPLRNGTPVRLPFRS